MPEISDRARRVPASPIRKLVPYAIAAKRRGVYVYHLNIGQPDISTQPAFLEAVRRWPGTVLAYEHSQGTAPLLSAFQSYYRRLGIDLEESQIQATTGGSEAILFAFAAVANPGEKVIVFEPFYTNYAGFAAQLGVELAPITTKAETGFHLPARNVIERAIDRKVRAILVCTPNNPTGTVCTREELQMLADICQKHDLFLLSDEAYREFCYEGEHVSVLTIDDLDDRAVLLDSLSKRFSACGARMGVLVSRNREVMAAALRMAQARLSSPTLEMAGATAALESPDAAAFIETTIEEYRRRRDVVLEGLRKIPGALCETPQGAFYVMATLPIEDSEEFAAWLLTDFEHNGRTVMVAPGPGFYATPGLGRKEVRIAYVLNCDDLRDAMALLAEAVAAFQRVGARA
jgi:aspartate aminotransferase